MFTTKKKRRKTAEIPREFERDSLGATWLEAHSETGKIVATAVKLRDDFWLLCRVENLKITERHETATKKTAIAWIRSLPEAPSISHRSKLPVGPMKLADGTKLADGFRSLDPDRRPAIDPEIEAIARRPEPVKPVPAPAPVAPLKNVPPGKKTGKAPKPLQTGGKAASRVIPAPAPKPEPVPGSPPLRELPVIRVGDPVPKKIGKIRPSALDRAARKIEKFKRPYVIVTNGVRQWSLTEENYQKSGSGGTGLLRIKAKEKR